MRSAQDYDDRSLGDVSMAAHLCRTALGARSKREHTAYRDRLICQCYDAGDVTRGDLAAVAHLSLSRIDAILRAGRRPPPPPKLRIVR